MYIYIYNYVRVSECTVYLNRYLYLCLCLYHSVPIFYASIYSLRYRHVTSCDCVFSEYACRCSACTVRQGVLEFICDMADYAFFGRAAQGTRSL